MKNRPLSSLSRYPIAAQGLLLGFGLLVCGSASAQNLLKNGNFESPLGPTNWTVMYLHGGPQDWEIKGRSRGGSLHAAWYGGYFRPITLKMAHACFAQTVSNLNQNQTYYLGGAMKQDRWKAWDDALRTTYLVYMEAIGGQGTPTPDGRASVLATNALIDLDGNSETNIEAPYTYPTIIWRGFDAQQTPDTNGNIEVRLHYYKVGFCTYDKPYISAASFDDIYLTP